jgi:acyl-CoA reductase-like NAD-dependent aldehyde dehydrogenase
MSDAIEQLCNFIDGRWEEAPDRMPAVNPATGGQIAWLPKSDRACARKAIAAAKRAKAAGGGAAGSAQICVSQ